MTAVASSWLSCRHENRSRRRPGLRRPEGPSPHAQPGQVLNYQLAKDYVGRLKAPLKGFYTFERSAHSPVMEEPQKARIIMREDVLAGTNSHADDSRR